jgi:hypothetical protein
MTIIMVQKTAQLPMLEAILSHPSGREIELALERLHDAARDSAAFAESRPLGRSRTVSLRRLGRAVEDLDRLLALT